MRGLRCIGLAMVCTLCSGGVALAVPGDVWDLSADFSIASNPHTVVASGGGTGDWTYLGPRGSTGFFDPYNFSFNGPAANANAELPSQGIGWRFEPGAGHISLSRFDSADGPQTDFQAGDVGGHSPLAADWTSNEGGTFLVETVAYNGRTAFFSREDTFSLIGPLGTLFSDVVGDANKRDNPVFNSAIVTLAAGESVRYQAVGGEWVGMNVTITELIPEPTSAMLLLSCGLVLVGCRRRS